MNEIRDVSIFSSAVQEDLLRQDMTKGVFGGEKPFNLTLFAAAGTKKTLAQGEIPLDPDPHAIDDAALGEGIVVAPLPAPG